jgi:hypothetical protein
MACTLVAGLACQIGNSFNENDLSLQKVLGYSDVAVEF